MRKRPGWNYFVLRSTGDELQKRLRAEAEKLQLPLAEIIRAALCAHYKLDCRPIKGVIRLDAWGATDTILCRFPPELFSRIKRDSARKHLSMRKCILKVLEVRYLSEAA